VIENRSQVGDIGGVEQTLEQMARSLVESGDDFGYCADIRSHAGLADRISQRYPRR